MDVRERLFIRRAEERDFPSILHIYEEARKYMAENGNPTQWVDGYPKESLLRQDMEKEALYVCEDMEDKNILAVFALFIGVEDPNYAYIEDGAWDNDEPYGVIHRIAVAREAHGKNVGLYCLERCCERTKNMRIDTHRDNIPMQKVIERAGFHYCGIVYMEDGSPRFAYMRITDKQ
ncbi:MAG: GNAT family N-acetyltransferase [Candidatus Avilachnospira sp.]|jgi:GNAT superfamily N-acetyltransferase